MYMLKKQNISLLLKRIENTLSRRNPQRAVRGRVIKTDHLLSVN